MASQFNDYILQPLKGLGAYAVSYMPVSNWSIPAVLSGLRITPHLIELKRQDSPQANREIIKRLAALSNPKERPIFQIADLLAGTNVLFAKPSGTHSEQRTALVKWLGMFKQPEFLETLKTAKLGELNRMIITQFTKDLLGFSLPPIMVEIMQSSEDVMSEPSVFLTPDRLKPLHPQIRQQQTLIEQAFLQLFVDKLKPKMEDQAHPLYEFLLSHQKKIRLG